jgi:hypothetical protein
MRVSLGERDGNNGVRERCSQIRQWTPIGFEWHEPSASAAAEERRGVGTIRLSVRDRLYGPEPPTPADLKREADHDRLVRVFPVIGETVDR